MQSSTISSCPIFSCSTNYSRYLLKASEKRGAIDFETIETQMVFNDQGKIERILPVKRNDAHRLDRRMHAGGKRMCFGFSAKT